MSDTLYLLDLYDHQTSEFIPVGIVTKDVMTKIVKKKPMLKDRFLSFKINKLDWDTIKAYRFNVNREDLL